MSHVRRVAYRLLRHRGARIGLRADLVLVHDRELGEYVRADLRNWIVRESGNAYMSVRDDVEFASLLAAARPVLGGRMADELRFLLGAS